MIRLVLFDIDGTLIQAGGAGGRAMERAWFEVFGVANGLAGVELGGRTDRSLFEELYRKHAVVHDVARHEVFELTFLHLLQEYILSSRGTLLDGAIQLLRELRAMESGVAIGLLTGNTRLAAEIKLRHFGIWEAFDLGAFGDDFACRNQLAGLARRRGESWLECSLGGEEILVIGDTLHDIRCARSIGARCLAVSTGSVRFGQLRSEEPDYLVRDLGDFKVSQLLVD